MIYVAGDAHPGVGENRTYVSQRDYSYSPELGCADVYSISPVYEAFGSDQDVATSENDICLEEINQMSHVATFA
jgi:hypothetical protein